MAAFVVMASAAGAARVVSAAGLHPLPDKRPAGWIAIEKVSDGCGQAGSVFRAHEQTYETDNGGTINVDFTEACNLHDAAYSGALVWDPINGNFIDYSEPKWTKAAINEKFKHDLQRLCFRAFPNAEAMGAEKALLTCLTSNDVRKGAVWGALSFVDLVNRLFGTNPRERIDLASRWKNTVQGWPLCDLAAMTITQKGREVTAEWPNGTGGDVGRFHGTLITGDQEGDDVVVGEYTVTDGTGGPQLSGGAMTFKVNSADKFDFNGAGVGGTMERVGRSTQGLLSAVAPRCKKPGTLTTPPAVGTFTLVPGLTEIKNAQGAALKIDPLGQSADLDHTGQFGGAGKGGEWKVHYTWKVPQTLVPGKKSSITIGATVSSVSPEQPLQVGIQALAPDFAQQLLVPYPNPPSLSKTYDYALAADQKDSKEIIVTIGFESSYVIYHYKPA